MDDIVRRVRGSVHLLMLLITSFLLGSPVGSSPEGRVLHQLTSVLAPYGIETRWGHPEEPQGDVVRLLPLDAFQGTPSFAASPSWEDEFLDGMDEAVVLPNAKRAFLSFTEADLESAMVIKTALERQLGYDVFAYRSLGRSQPWTTPRRAGTYFAQANVRLVVDTPASRRSSGVAFEKRMARLQSRRNS
ncbi:MAG: hypothetical protein AAGA48_08850 [Myxococcota bacterium]